MLTSKFANIRCRIGKIGTILGSCLFLFSHSVAFSAEVLPFTDVATSAPYYSDVLTLFQRGVIQDTKDHLFHPNDLLARDELVSIVVGVGCKSCLNPTEEDILKYVAPPFYDTKASDRFHYCVSYAKDVGIIQGYVLDPASGKVKCQNGSEYSVVPFCAANNITRVEAAAILLRHAGLWSEALNVQPPSRDMALSDVDNYWYGYAKKSILMDMVSARQDGKYFPSEFITKKEFVHMAVKILTANACELKDVFGSSGLRDQKKSEFDLDLKVFDRGQKAACTGKPKESGFLIPGETAYSFYADSSVRDDTDYRWTFTNIETGKQLQTDGKCLTAYDLKDPGTWIVQLDGINRVTKQVSHASQTITVTTPCKGDCSCSPGSSCAVSGAPQCTQSGACVPNAHFGISVLANPLEWYAPFASAFAVNVSGGTGPFTYDWDFGDGSAHSNLPTPTHTYGQIGTFPVRVTVRDSKGRIATAVLAIQSKRTLDADADSVLDKDDACPKVAGPASNKGCPTLREFQQPASVNRPVQTGNANVSADIRIFDKNAAKSSDGTATEISLIGLRDTVYDQYAWTLLNGDYLYDWKFIHEDGSNRSAQGKFLDNYDYLKPGTWDVYLTVTDRVSGAKGFAKERIVIGTDLTGTTSPNACKCATGSMCSPDGSKTCVRVTADIRIFDKNAAKSSDGTATEISLVGLTDTVYDQYAWTRTTGNYQYDWKFVHKDGTVRTTQGKFLDNYDYLKPGEWEIYLTVTDPANGSKEYAYEKIFIGNGNPGTNTPTGGACQPGCKCPFGSICSSNDTKSCTVNGRCVSLPDIGLRVSATPIGGPTPTTVSFFSNLTGVSPTGLKFDWDFGDNATHASGQNPTHEYTSVGGFPVVLTVTDTNGNSLSGQLTVETYKACTQACSCEKGSICTTTQPGVCAKEGRCIPDGSDPTKPTYKGDGQIDDSGFAKDVAAISDACTKTKVQNFGMIQWTLQCNACPCALSVDFASPLRQCDIIFPTILSPNKKTIYSRGAVYQMQ